MLGTALHVEHHQELRRRQALNTLSPPFPAVQPSAALRIAIGENDHDPYAGQDGTAVTATVTGESQWDKRCQLLWLAPLSLSYWGHAAVVLLALWCRRHSTLLLLLSFWALAAGTVWEIKVKVGDAVKAGDTLVSGWLGVSMNEAQMRRAMSAPLTVPGAHPCTLALPLPRRLPLAGSLPGLSLPRLLQIVLEAMKMEAAVVAPCDGTVKDIHVQSADMVQQGNPMCLLV
jgi:hypothetical protein